MLPGLYSGVPHSYAIAWGILIMRLIGASDHFSGILTPQLHRGRRDPSLCEVWGGRGRGAHFAETSHRYC